MNRRMFLQGLAALPLLQAVPLLAEGRAKPPVLLLVELNGGNDSLNTVIPRQQLSAYRRLRPDLGLKPEEQLALDGDFAVHPALAPLRSLWQAGELALVHGLGYPQPNRSHFRSIEIWDTASASDEFLEQGWLAGPAHRLGAGELDGLVFGRNASSLAGGDCRFLAIENLKAFMAQSGRIERALAETPNPALQRVLEAQSRIQAGGRLLRGNLPRGAAREAYPSSLFGRQLADAARVIRADLGIPVLKVALGGFDTHRNQKPVHARLLRQLAEGLVALRQELSTSGHWDRVLVVTYSEFGRRAAQNASGGTDHGTAATHFVLGGRVRGGHLGEHPDLEQLEDRDMRYSTDFRRLYQTVLSDWWQRPDLRVPGGDWETLDLIG